METQQQAFNEQSALQLVEEMIQSAKHKIDDNGFLFLLWGWIMIAGNVASYFFHVHQLYPWIGISWGVLGTFGGIYTGIYIRRTRQKRAAKTYVDAFMGYLWGGFGIAMIIIDVNLMILHNFQLINPLVLLLVGIATFTSGGVLKFTPLLIGGIIFWIFSIVNFMVQSEVQFLISAGATILGYLIPGYILSERSKKLKKN